MELKFSDRIINPKHSFINAFENYCYTGKSGCRTYKVISQNDNVIENQPENKTKSSQVFFNVLRVASLFTVVVPVFMIISKLIYRSQHKFTITSITKENPPNVNINKISEETLKKPST